jgi:hypothetical protein
METGYRKNTARPLPHVRGREANGLGRVPLFKTTMAQLIEPVLS